MKAVEPRTSTLQDSVYEPKTKQTVQKLSRGDQWKLLTLSLILLDSGMIFLAFRLSYWIRFGASLPIFQLDVVPSPQVYNGLTLTLLAVWVAGLAISGLYNRQNLLQGTRETALLLRACTACIFVVMVMDFMEISLDMARGWVLIAWLMTFVFTSLGRYIVRRCVQGLRQFDLFLSPAVIVGANLEARLLAEQFERRQYSGLKVIGFIDDSLPVDTPLFHQIQVIGKPENIQQIVEEHQVEELILATSAIDQDELIALFQTFGVSSTVNLRMSSGLYEIIATGFQVREFSSVPLVGINKVRLTGLDQAAKLILDYSIAIPVLILLLPVLLVIGILVKLDSPGPAFYRRRVMGVNGRQFDAFKFRTMVVNGDEVLNGHPELWEEYRKNIKLKNDPRVTRLGKFLRKASLDELPQLFNVLRNEMSLVGPRMICPDEMALYQQAGINLLTVKPGITGLWQVSGRSEISYDARVKMDMYYIRNWSIWFDLQLLLRTIPAVLRSHGAY